jgi:DNA-binding response OmpR family regulator
VKPLRSPSGLEGPADGGPPHTQILVVDTDFRLTTLLRRSLEGQDVEVAQVWALSAALAQPGADLVLLDPGLPGCDGAEAVRALRRTTDPGIILVTGDTSAAARIRGLRAGADDVITKPFVVGELLARIDAVLRRCRRAGTRQLIVGSLVIDLDTRHAMGEGRALRLTGKEFAILALLADQAGIVVARQHLISQVWSSARLGSSRTLEVHISALRAKLAGIALVENVRGVGYRLRPVVALSVAAQF